ncbi:MAG: hypothetical protein KDC98_18145 [Planctomycetes bacterium]|nr:hypothetical protein [Planctomycetota bacterium]
MDGDPFEDFGEQLQSFELLDEHRSVLVENAREMLREAPGTQVVGLILDGEAGEAATFRDALAQVTGEDLTGRGFLGVAPRQFVVDMLLRDAPAALEWLPSSSTRDREGEVVHWLPLVALTKNGVRFSAVRLAEAS